jgi:hypothetical protein
MMARRIHDPGAASSPAIGFSPAGVLGATFVWGSTELKEQSIRARSAGIRSTGEAMPFRAVIKKWRLIYEPVIIGDASQACQPLITHARNHLMRTSPLGI